MVQQDGLSMVTHRHIAPERASDASREKGAARVSVTQRGRMELMKTAGDGALDVADEAGLREAFLAHGGELFGFARRSLNSTQNAEDVVQETFSRAWRSRARFDPTLGSLRTWLFTIERRVILDFSVRQAKHATVSLDQAHEPASEDHL